MFLFIILATCHKITEPSETNRSFPAGYYNMTLIGGQGGKGCFNGEPTNYTGGHGAIISGIVHLKGINEYRIVVGGSPSTICITNTVNKGSFYGEGGDSGKDKLGDIYTGGGGGGYSLFEIKDGELIAIAGGGSGSSAETNGASAGGRNQNYWINGSDGDEDICNETTDGPCFTDYRRGGNGDYAISAYPGSGGGGGAKGGSESILENNGYAWKSVAKGGSSDWNDTYFIGEPKVSVGIFNGAEGDGSFTLEPLTKCNSSCYDCEYGNANNCTECFEGNFSFEGSCFKSCADTSKPTYQNGTRCKSCIEGCSKCQDGTTCEECLPGYVRSNQICIPQQTPQATPSFTPSTTPQMTPSSTPQTTLSITPSNTPSFTPSTTPSDTQLIIPSMTPAVIEVVDPDDGKNNNKPDENPTQSSDSKHVDGLGGGTTNGNEGENKVPIGLIIGIIVGVLALIGIIAFAIYYCTRSREENDSFEEEMNEETIMSTTEFNSVTFDNPMFTTSITHDPEDVFKDDFEEKFTSEIFHLHDEEI